MRIYRLVILLIFFISVNAQADTDVYFPESGTVLSQGIQYTLLWNQYAFDANSLLTIRMYESDGLIGGITDDLVFTLGTDIENTGSGDFSFNNISDDYDFQTESEYYFFIEVQCGYIIYSCPDIESELFYITDEPEIKITPMDTLAIIIIVADPSILKYRLQVRDNTNGVIVDDTIVTAYNTANYNPFYLTTGLNPETSYSYNMYYGYECLTCEGGVIFSYGSGFLYDFTTSPKALCTYDSVSAFFSQTAYLDWYFDESTDTGASFYWCGVTWDTIYVYSVGVDHSFVHKSKNQVVVSFRGTEFLSITDWIDNTNSLNMIECQSYICSDSNSEIASGFYEAFIASQPLTIARKLADIGERDIIMTGHSQGAAVATIASVYIGNYFDQKYDIYTYTFGSPSVGNEEFAFEFLVSTKISSRYVAKVDDPFIITADLVTASGPLGSVHVDTLRYLLCENTIATTGCHSMDNYLVQMFKTVPVIGVLIGDDAYYNPTTDVATTYGGLSSGDSTNYGGLSSGDSTNYGGLSTDVATTYGDSTNFYISYYSSPRSSPNSSPDISSNNGIKNVLSYINLFIIVFSLVILTL